MKTEETDNLIKTESGISRNLFSICSIVTIAVMGLTVVDFFSRGSFIPANINFFYLAVLLVYSLHKELLRWLGEKRNKREGEIFVYFWVILTTVLYVVNFFSHDYYSFSKEGYEIATLRDVSILTVEVLGVFFFTRLLKLLEVLRHNQGKKSGL
ncbi:MAG: hypothetical protein Q8N61_01040 [bacterium]|nr:hypothetical protein [bacterium]